MIRYALHLRYTSLQAYRLLLEKPSMLSLSLLNNIQQGGVDALKALKIFMKRFLFSWLYFDDRWNVFAKICTVSISRVCRGRKFVIRNFSVYGRWIKSLYLLLFKPFQKSHLTDSGWPRKLVITLTISKKSDFLYKV